MREVPAPLVLLGGRYSREEYALADLGRVKALHERLDLVRALDAAVVHRSWDGRVEVVRTYEPTRREGARQGLGLGLAAGALVAVLPGVGLGAALLGAAGVGSTLGAMTAGRRAVLPKRNLRELGALLAQGSSGLVVVTCSHLVDQVETVVVHADEVVRHPLRVGDDRCGAAS